MLKKVVSASQIVPYKRTILILVLAFSMIGTVGSAVFAAAPGNTLHIVGPKKNYLAVGDSLAFGFQPDLNFDEGYANYFFTDLQHHGVQSRANLGCPGETSITMINGQCPYPFLRKFPYIGSQLNAAVQYINDHKGQVSPVTLDIGANDIIGDINTKTCALNLDQFKTDLATLDTNLTRIILPRLQAALTVNGTVTGDILVMNMYDPFQNICPTSVQFAQTLNQHIANDAQGFGHLVDVFTPFGGTATPNSNICSFTWMCSIFKDIHSQDKGYSIIAQAFERTAGY